MNILALCHGHKHKYKKYESCNTDIVDISNAVLLDKDRKCQPDIIQDWLKPIQFKTKFDIITTKCCDGDVFYDYNTKTIQKQSFVNINKALSKKGIFIMPIYNWLNKKILLEMSQHLILQKKFKTFYVFSKLH